MSSHFCTIVPCSPISDQGEQSQPLAFVTQRSLATYKTIGASENEEDLISTHGLRRRPNQRHVSDPVHPCS